MSPSDFARATVFVKVGENHYWPLLVYARIENVVHVATLHGQVLREAFSASE